MLTQREKLLSHLRHRCALGTKLGSWSFLRCSVSSCFRRKCLLQGRQEKGFSPVCVRMCAVKHRSCGKAGTQLTQGEEFLRTVCHYRVLPLQSAVALLRARACRMQGDRGHPFLSVQFEASLVYKGLAQETKSKTNENSTAHTWKTYFTS